MSSEGEHRVIVPEKELHDFITRTMEKVGTRTEQAQSLADVLTSADMRGHYSHGLNRLGYYTADVANGLVAVDEEPEILRETLPTAYVDGKNCLGPVVGKFCIDIAIEKARTSGVGWVCAKRSNHFGIAGWYGLRAMEQGLIGMAFTNSSPNLVPTRAKAKTLGTNPICVAAKGMEQEKFVLDMATTAVAQGKIEIQHRLGKDLPHGWGVDRNGKPCTNTEEVLYHGGLAPLGGVEETGGYKGYGLGMIVELFCGILSGSDFGTGIRHWSDHETEANLGQCFVAVNPKMFAPGFEGRLSELMHQCKDQEPVEGESEILIPGEPEERHIALCKQLGGIPYHEKQVAFADELAEKYDVAPLKRL